MISKLLSWKCFLFHENESNFHVGLEFSTTWRQISWDHWWLFIGCVLTPSPIYTGAACALLFRAEKDTGKRSGIHVNTSATSLPQPHWLAELRFSNGKERSRHYCPRHNEQRRTDPTGGWRHSPPRSGRNKQRRTDPTGGWRHSPPRSGRNEQRRTDPTGRWRHSPLRSGRNEQRRTDPTGRWRHSPPRSGRNEQRRNDPTGGWRHSPPRSGRNEQRRTDPTGGWRHSPPRNGHNKQRRTDPTGGWRHSPPRNGRNEQRRTDPTGGWRHSPPRSGRNEQRRTDPTGGWRHSPPRSGRNEQRRTDPQAGGDTLPQSSQLDSLSVSMSCASPEFTEVNMPVLDSIPESATTVNQPALSFFKISRGLLVSVVWFFQVYWTSFGYSQHVSAGYSWV